MRQLKQIFPDSQAAQPVGLSPELSLPLKAFFSPQARLRATAIRKRPQSVVDAVRC